MLGIRPFGAENRESPPAPKVGFRTVAPCLHGQRAVIPQAPRPPATQGSVSFNHDLRADAGQEHSSRTEYSLLDLYGHGIIPVCHAYVMPLGEQDIRAFFERPEQPAHRQYEALSAFVYKRRSARQVAERFGYSRSSVYTVARIFRRLEDPGRHFFATRLKPRRPGSEPSENLRRRIVELRDGRLSVPDIRKCLQAEQGHPVSACTAAPPASDTCQCEQPTPDHCCRSELAQNTPSGNRRGGASEQILPVRIPPTMAQRRGHVRRT